ncbi:hypothetical protein [Aeromonas jandaei]|nr:hypothetical protein [Aeromonas jandaei]
MSYQILSATVASIFELKRNPMGMHIPADHEHRFWFNVNTISGPT